MSGEPDLAQAAGGALLAVAAGAPEAGSPLRRIARVLVRADARRLYVHDWRRTLAGEPPLPAAPIRAVAIVCKGNICRSPFAAALLARALPGLAVGSYGLAAAVDEPAEPTARTLAREWGCDLGAHRTRRFGAAEAGAADLILAMDALQGHAIARQWPAAAPRVRLLGDYLPARPFAIVDPWGRSEPVWRDSYARIALAVERLAARLEGAA